MHKVWQSEAGVERQGWWVGGCGCAGGPGLDLVSLTHWVPVYAAVYAAPE